MTDDQTPAEPTPSADPPPLAPLVQQAAAPSAPPPPIAPPVAPPVAWAAPPVAVAVRGGRTTLAAIAGVGLIILGVLGALLGLLFAIVGASIVASLGNFADIPELNGANAGTVVSGLVAFFGIIIVVYSLVYLIAGIGVVRSRGWGRVIGIIIGILSSLFWFAGLSGSARSDSTASGGAFVLVMLGIHLYIAVVLLFWWRRKTA